MYNTDYKETIKLIEEKETAKRTQSNHSSHSFGKQKEYTGCFIKELH